MSDDQSTADKVKAIAKKFFAPNSKPTMETFPELVDCIIWLRFALAVFFGVYAGTNLKNGSTGGNLLMGLNFIAFPPAVYCQTFLAADQESYGLKLYFSGLFQGLALAMLIWFYFYTAAHEKEEAIFAAAFANLVGGLGDAGSDSGVESVIPEESEF